MHRAKSASILAKDASIEYKVTFLENASGGNKILRGKSRLNIHPPSPMYSIIHQIEYKNRWGSY